MNERAIEPLAGRSEAILSGEAGTAKATDPAPQVLPSRPSGGKSSGQALALLRKRLAAAKWRCEHATGPNRSYAGIVQLSGRWCASPAQQTRSYPTSHVSRSHRSAWTVFD